MTDWALPLMAVVQAATVLLMFAMDADEAASKPVPEEMIRDSLTEALLPDPLIRTAWSPIPVNRQLLTDSIAVAEARMPSAVLEPEGPSTVEVIT